MRAIILAGGKGTRLKPYTTTIPKPLLPIGDFPILEIVLIQLARNGFTRITLLLNHMAHLFTAILGDGSRFGVQLDFVTEIEPMGTAGSIALVRDLPGEFLVMNGDLLTTLNYRELFEAHIAQKNAATIAVNKREHKVDFGVIESDEMNFLTDYREKPSLLYSVSMGVNMLNRDCLSYIQPGKYLDMPSLMLAMKKDHKSVRVFPSDCYWQDIGRVDDYERATQDFQEDMSKFLK